MLDVVSQLELVDLLAALKRDLGLGLCVVTHDLNVAAALCESIQVMKDGQTVEEGRTADVLSNPRHPYTAGLVEAARW